MATTGKQRDLAGASLLHRLQQLAEGVAKHKAEAGFPNYFTATDAQAEHDLLGSALTDAKAADGRYKELYQSTKAQSGEMQDLYDRGVAAVESFYGLDSLKLKELGLRPRKGPYSAHAKMARSAHKARARRKAKKAAKGEGGGAASGTPVTGAGSNGAPTGGK